MMRLKFRLLMLFLPALVSCRQALATAEKNVVQPLINEMNAHCIGRYLIDLPRELRVKGGIFVSDVKIISTEMSLRQFNENVLMRGSKLKLMKSHDEHPFFYKEGKGDSEHTTYFISRGFAYKAPAVRLIEAYKWDRGYEIKLEVEGVDFTDPDQTNDRLVKKMTDINDVPRKTSIVLDLLSRIRGRPEQDIPSEPGVCFFGGFIAGTAGETEKVVSSYGILANPDVVIMIRTYTDLKLDTMLLDRSDGMSVLEHFNAKTLRKGVVDLPNLPAQEWLISARTRTGVPGHDFMFEANPKSGLPHAPMVSLGLKTALTGKNYENPPKKSSLSDDEVVEVWDAVSRSLRVRPNGF